MLGVSCLLRTHYNHVKYIGLITRFDHRVYSNKDKGDCCKQISQTEGKKVVNWSKDCPNNDPYKIRVPEVTVPPLPPSNAKWLLTSSKNPEDQYPRHPRYENPQTQGGLPPESAKEEEARDEGLMGLIKGWLRQKGKPKGDSSTTSIVGKPEFPSIDCSRQRGVCSAKPPPSEPPCPVPPKKLFPWCYVYAALAFVGFMGLMYKWYLWNEERKRLDEFSPIWRPREVIKRPRSEQDLPPCVQYLIVGTGAAGWGAYNAIMKHDKTAKVFFISREDVLPYIRPPLTKYMWWNPRPPDMRTLSYIVDKKQHSLYYEQCKNFLDPVTFYQKKTGPAVSIATGWCVTRVDPDSHVVYVNTSNGEHPIYYERLLLAPGSKAKNLSIFKKAPKNVRKKVTTLRTIRDLDIAYRKVQEAKHVTIIGGGILGSELAYYLARAHKEIDWPGQETRDPPEIVHVIRDKGILSSVLPEYLGEWAVEKIRSQGTKVLAKTQVYDAFETKDGRIELTLSDGSSLVTDYIFVAVGAEPRTELAVSAELELDEANGGFLVNAEMEARRHLYVAGDAASFYAPMKDTRYRLEHYGNAEEQGMIAGMNMTGFWETANIEPHFWFKLQKDLVVEGVGEIGACMPTVGLFKQCDAENVSNEMAKPPPLPQLPTRPNQASGDGDRPCYKKTEEYKNRYKRGMLFYMRDETIVGIVFWNLVPFEDRYKAASEVLRARPTYKDINMISDLLGFHEAQCEYTLAPGEDPLAPVCIMRKRTY